MYFNGLLQRASDPHSKTPVRVISLLWHLRACGGKHYQIVTFHMIVVDWCIVANGNDGLLQNTFHFDVTLCATKKQQNMHNGLKRNQEQLLNSSGRSTCKRSGKAKKVPKSRVLARILEQWGTGCGIWVCRKTHPLQHQKVLFRQQNPHDQSWGAKYRVLNKGKRWGTMYKYNLKGEQWGAHNNHPHKP